MQKLVATYLGLGVQYLPVFMVLGSKAVNRKSNAEVGEHVTPMQRNCQWRITRPAPSPSAETAESAGGVSSPGLSI